MKYANYLFRKLLSFYTMYRYMQNIVTCIRKITFSTRLTKSCLLEKKNSTLFQLRCMISTPLFGLAIIICADNLRFNLFYVVSCTITIKNKFSFLPLIFSRILREDVVVLIGDAYVFGRCSLLLPCSSADMLPLHLFGWYNKW